MMTLTQPDWISSGGPIPKSYADSKSLLSLIWTLEQPIGKGPAEDFRLCLSSYGVNSNNNRYVSHWWQFGGDCFDRLFFLISCTPQHHHRLYPTLERVKFMLGQGCEESYHKNTERHGQQGGLVVKQTVLQLHDLHLSPPCCQASVLKCHWAKHCIPTRHAALQVN